MKIIKGKDFLYSNTCVTIGKFDGVHVGHRHILNELHKISVHDSLTSVVLTFDYSYFNDNKKNRLNSYEEKLKLLEEFGTDIMIDYPFDDETRNLSAENFIRFVLLKRLGVKSIVVGENFKFGKGAEGTVQTLKYFGGIFGYDTLVIPCIEFEGETVSSTRIREEINLGNIERADRMLGKNSMDL